MLDSSVKNYPWMSVSAPPPLDQATRSAAERGGYPTQRSGGTPLVGALAPHGVSGRAGSHLGSTLNPGRAVLTLGVFRRSRSVAYVRSRRLT